MRNKKNLILLGILILALGASAFIAGKWLNRRGNPVVLGAPFEGDFRSMVVPAPELPAGQPEIAGPFIERQDNAIIVETKSIGGSSIVSASRADTKSQSGPLVEVVVTNKTIIYRETTDPGEPLSAENQTILQTVERASLDDLNAQSMVMVWGRKNGDRIIAEILMFSDLVAVKSAIFEDCEICP